MEIFLVILSNYLSLLVMIFKDFIGFSNFLVETYKFVIVTVFYYFCVSFLVVFRFIVESPSEKELGFLIK